MNPAYRPVARSISIAGSADWSKIWVTLVGHLTDRQEVSGGVLELPAFKPSLFVGEPWTTPSSGHSYRHS
jgi:hypothetical protein